MRKLFLAIFYDVLISVFCRVLLGYLSVIGYFKRNRPEIFIAGDDIFKVPTQPVYQNKPGFFPGDVYIVMREILLEGAIKIH